MFLTKQTNISLRVMKHLALVPDELSTITDIAERYEISRNHLVKVVHQLAQRGYLTTVQGRGGGMSLAKASDEINVGEVVRAMEQTLDVVDCQAFNCSLGNSCIL